MNNPKLTILITSTSVYDSLPKIRSYMFEFIQIYTVGLFACFIRSLMLWTNLGRPTRSVFLVLQTMTRNIWFQWNGFRLEEVFCWKLHFRMRMSSSAPIIHVRCFSWLYTNSPWPADSWLMELKLPLATGRKLECKKKRVNQGSEWEEFGAVIVRVGRLFHALEFNCTNVANGPSVWKLPKFNQRIKALKKLVSFLRLSTEN